MTWLVLNDTGPKVGSLLLEVMYAATISLCKDSDVHLLSIGW